MCGPSFYISIPQSHSTINIVIQYNQTYKFSIFLVDNMVGKYGAGETSLFKCPTCDYEQEIRSSGVHISEGGSVSVFSEEDEFCCPNCVSKSDKQANKICSKLTL